MDYCDGILATRDLYGDDIEDLMESLQYQWSTAFGIMQIGEAVKRLSSELLERYWDVPWSEIEECATVPHTNTIVTIS